jgi:hypothetical protein
MAALSVVAVWAMLAPATLIGPTPAQAQAMFSHECRPDGRIQFLYYGQPWHELAYDQIAAPLATAIATHQHQLVGMEPDVSLWALYHNELQIHRNDDPDGTKYIIPAQSCGTGGSPPPALLTSQAWALAGAEPGGRASALAVVAPDGSVLAWATVEGPGWAWAGAQSALSGGTGGARVHVVMPGENLFRLALRYGVPLSRLAAANHIADANLIYAGQTLVIP